MDGAARVRGHGIGAPLRVAILAILLLAATRALFGLGGPARTVAHLVDFNAFYCAGAAVDAGRDPYLAEPLRSCEAAAGPSNAEALGLSLVAMPAPLPGYALALFALLARLPLDSAVLVFVALLVGALGITSILLEALTRVPRYGVLSALALCDGWVSLGYGQIVALSVLLLCGAALAIAHHRPVTAALCAAGAMIEPHVALPACIALFVFASRTRVTLLLAGAALAAISLQITGWHENIEYLSRVLPAHALAEANDIGQYSLTALLNRLGVEPAAALWLADLSYAGMLTLGVLVASRLAARSGAPEMLVCVPPAFTLLGGPFLHTSQMAVAVPALLLLLYRFPARRGLLCGALLIMAIPWQEVAENPVIPGLAAVAAAGAGIAAYVFAAKPGRALTIVTAATAVAGFERWMRVTHAPRHLDLHAELLRAMSGSLPADVTWAIHARSIVGTPWYIASHVPAWTGLLLMIGIAVSLAWRSIPSAQPAP